MLNRFIKGVNEAFLWVVLAAMLTTAAAAWLSVRIEPVGRVFTFAIPAEDSRPGAGG